MQYSSEQNKPKNKCLESCSTRRQIRHPGDENRTNDSQQEKPEVKSCLRRVGQNEIRSGVVVPGAQQSRV